MMKVFPCKEIKREVVTRLESLHMWKKACRSSLLKEKYTYGRLLI